MKLIKLLFIKYILSLTICIISSAVIFFIFSLIGNLDEEHLFNIIIKISFFNSLQILSYVPSFIFVISVILFIIFLRSKNEMIIIKSYINIRLLLIFTLPIVFFFTFIEINKNELVSFFEDTKTSLMDKGNQNSTKIIITRDNYSKSFIVLKNVNMNDLTQLEYRSYDVFKKKIQSAQFSDNLIINNGSILAKSYTEYKDDLIQDFKFSKLLDLKIDNIFQQSSIVKEISNKNIFSLNFKLINLSIFFILYFSYVFLLLFNKNLVSTKYSMTKPVFISIAILIYSFLVFNNSLSFYRQEFEILASFIVGLSCLKIYLNE